MSTYNGSEFIAEQLNTILKQDYADLTLSIVDDCSKDDTLKVVAAVVGDDSRVNFRRNSVNLGVNQSFGEVIAGAQRSDFYCLSDQDDLWPDGRLSQFIAIASEADEKIPTLYVCQYQVFSGDVKAGVSPEASFELLSLNSANIDWKRNLLSGNSLYGCCFFFNHALKELLGSIPKGRTTHDYWIALVAAYTGRIVLLPFVGTFYRQHTNNASYGAPSRNWRIKFSRLGRSLSEDIRARIDISTLFAALVAQHGNRLAAMDKVRLAQAAKAYEAGSVALIWFQIREKVWRPNLSANILRVAACLLQIFRREPASTKN